MERTGITTEEQAEIWRRYRTGESMRSISRALRPSLDQIRRVIAATGGRAPRLRPRSARRLSVAEREEISRGVAAGHSCRCIARRLRRAASTVSREIAHNGGRPRYRARRAEAAARARARRPWPIVWTKPRRSLRCMSAQRVGFSMGERYHLMWRFFRTSLSGSQVCGDVAALTCRPRCVRLPSDGRLAAILVTSRPGPTAHIVPSGFHQLESREWGRLAYRPVSAQISNAISCTGRRTLLCGAIRGRHAAGRPTLCLSSTPGA